MGKEVKITAESSIRYHETNLSRLIGERNAALERKAKGEHISDYYLERTDGAIADIENIIHNWRTKGRGYD